MTRSHVLTHSHILSGLLHLDVKNMCYDFETYRWTARYLHLELRRKYHSQYADPTRTNSFTSFVDISWENFNSINFADYAVAQMLDGVRCHILCDMQGHIFCLFNTINNPAGSLLRLKESVKCIGRGTGVTGYVFEAIYCIAENNYRCYDIVRIAHQNGRRSDSLFERKILLKELVESIGILQLGFKPHHELSTFETSSLTCAADLLFTRRVKNYIGKPVCFIWRHKITINFTLSRPVEEDEYDLCTSRVLTDVSKIDSGKLLLSKGVPHRIQLRPSQIPRLERRNVVELAFTESKWTFVRHRPDLEYAHTLHEVFALLDLNNKPLLLNEIMRRSGHDRAYYRGSYTPTSLQRESSVHSLIQSVQITGPAFVEKCLLLKIPDCMFLYITGSQLTIVDIERLSTTSLSIWQACDHVRLAAPTLCFDQLSINVRDRFFMLASRGISWFSIGDIVSGKQDLCETDIMEIRTLVNIGIDETNGVCSFYSDHMYIRPLMHLSSFRTQRELSLFLFKSSFFQTYLSKQFNYDAALLPAALSGWR